MRKLTIDTYAEEIIRRTTTPAFRQLAEQTLIYDGVAETEYLLSRCIEIERDADGNHFADLVRCECKCFEHYSEAFFIIPSASAQILASAGFEKSVFYKDINYIRGILAVLPDPARYSLAIKKWDGAWDGWKEIVVDGESNEHRD